jgi:hypothetical protein
LKTCDQNELENRIDFYEEAAIHGSTEALYSWAMIKKYGSEGAESICGISAGIKENSNTEQEDFDQHRATIALLYCVEMGFSKALIPLSFVLLSEIGAAPFTNYRTFASIDKFNIPLPHSYSFSYFNNDSQKDVRYYKLSKLQFLIGKFLGTNENKIGTVYSIYFFY